MILSRKAQNIGASLTLALTAKSGELKKRRNRCSKLWSRGA